MRIMLTTILMLAASLLAAVDIAIVRLEAVYSKANFLNVATARLQEQANTVNDQMDDIRAQIENQQKIAKVAKKGSPEHFQATEKLEVLKLRQKMFFEHQKRRLDAAEIAMLKRGYTKISEELKVYAKDKGIKMVQQASPTTMASRNIAEFRVELATLTVLAYDDSLDITDDFIVFLNQRVAKDYFTAGASQPSFALDEAPEGAKAPAAKPTGGAAEKPAAPKPAAAEKKEP